MKLYHTPGTCSHCPQIVLNEIGADHELVQVDLREKKLGDGADYAGVAPKQQVPMLELDDGERFTECAAIVQYLADKHPEAGLAPAPGTPERYRLAEWLSYVGSELHKTLPALFLPYIPDDYRPIAEARLRRNLDYLEKELAGREYLMGDSYTIADSYCYAILRWTNPAQFNLGEYPNVKAYYDRIEARPAVQAAVAS